jgi:small subunit ribosomal protein S14
MKYLKVKDIKNRQNFFLNEKKKIIKKTIFTNFLNSFSNNFKNKHSIFLYILIKKLTYFHKSSKTKINRRCILSNRNRAIIRPFNISRIIFKDLIYFGLLPGYKKAVW